MRTKNGSRTNRDSRNDLIFDVLRIVRSMKPKSVMLENVPGLAENSRYVAFCKGLESQGYRVKSAILNTVDFGVPQRRRRLVVLASRLAEPAFAPKATVFRTVREFIGNLTPPERSRDPLHSYSVQRSKKVTNFIRRIPRNGGSRMALGQEEQLSCHQRLEGFWDVYGRMAWDKPAPTITGGCINPSKGRFLHPRANRAITLREAALLQTFPKKYRFPLDKGRYQVATALRQTALSVAKSG
jgi:DNA (cytosine-5)-methyltransferase 1